jgi:hypothetical protein
MTIEAVLARVAESDTTADRDQLRRTVLDTIAALGLYVNTKTGEVYNPAPAPRSTIPQQTGVRFKRRY